MSKYNVSGTFLMGIYADGIEANSENEAIQKFKEMIENGFTNGVNLDWLDNTDKITAEEQFDNQRIEDALFSSFPSCDYIGKNKVDFAEFPSTFLGVDTKGIKVCKTKTNGGRDFTFIEVNEQIAFPVDVVVSVDDREKLERLELVEEKMDSWTDIFLYYWCIGSNVYFLEPNGNLVLAYSDKNGFTTIQHRLDYLYDNLSEEYNDDFNDFVIVSSKPQEMVLIPLRRTNITYTATYSSAYDEVPDSLTKTEQLI